ncbi:hypothetical protein CDD83_657 [Cordyceps sp. RAO-2017]|nr:hypothetical protein CDD83_657 [Cordyceps sp. RAO-2017]
MAATAATAPLQGIAGDVHAQILASLEEHRIHSEEHLINGRAVGGGGSGGRDNGQDPQADERGNPADDLSRQLHQVIGAMLKHLRSKEEAGHRIPEIYRTNTTGCVEKIGNRQGQERKALAETMRGDADKFRHVVGKARRAVVDNRRRWESGLAELQQTTDRRQAMYERAATSLRALHRQLLDGAEAKGKGKGAFLQKQQAETTGGESMTSGQGPAA